MSENNLKQQQIFQQNSNRPRVAFNEESFYGLDDILQTWADGLLPEPLLKVSQWADEYRMLSQKSAAEAGRWKTSRTPYLKEIMDELSPSSPTQRVVFMKGAQIGGTEAGNNWIGYVMHMAPGPMLAVSPTVELAKRQSKQRIDPMIGEMPVLAEKVKPARSRDSGNTILSKDFIGGVLVLTGANWCLLVLTGAYWCLLVLIGANWC